MTAMTCSATSWGYPHLDAPWNAGSSSVERDALRERERQARAQRAGVGAGEPGGHPIFRAPIKVDPGQEDEISRRIKSTLGDFSQVQRLLSHDPNHLIGISRTNPAALSTSASSGSSSSRGTSSASTTSGPAGTAPTNGVGSNASTWNGTAIDPGGTRGAGGGSSSSSSAAKHQSGSSSSANGSHPSSVQPSLSSHHSSSASSSGGNTGGSTHRSHHGSSHHHHSHHHHKKHQQHQQPPLSNGQYKSLSSSSAGAAAAAKGVRHPHSSQPPPSLHHQRASQGTAEQGRPDDVTPIPKSSAAVPSSGAQCGAPAAPPNGLVVRPPAMRVPSKDVNNGSSNSASSQHTASTTCSSLTVRTESNGPANGSSKAPPVSRTAPASNESKTKRPLPRLQIPPSHSSDSVPCATHPELESIFKEMKKVPPALTAIETPRKEDCRPYFPPSPVQEPVSNHLDENGDSKHEQDLRKAASPPGSSLQDDLEMSDSDDEQVPPIRKSSSSLGFSSTKDTATNENIVQPPAQVGKMASSESSSSDSEDSSSASSGSESESSDSEASAPETSREPSTQSWKLANFIDKRSSPATLGSVLPNGSCSTSRQSRGDPCDSLVDEDTFNPILSQFPNQDADLGLMLKSSSPQGLDLVRSPLAKVGPSSSFLLSPVHSSLSGSPQHPCEPGIGSPEPIVPAVVASSDDDGPCQLENGRITMRLGKTSKPQMEASLEVSSEACSKPALPLDPAARRSWPSKGSKKETSPGLVTTHKKSRPNTETLAKPEPPRERVTRAASPVEEAPSSRGSSGSSKRSHSERFKEKRSKLHKSRPVLSDSSSDEDGPEAAPKETGRERRSDPAASVPKGPRPKGTSSSSSSSRGTPGSQKVAASSVGPLRGEPALPHTPPEPPPLLSPIAQRCGSEVKEVSEASKEVSVPLSSVCADVDGVVVRVALSRLLRPPGRLNRRPPSPAASPGHSREHSRDSDPNPSGTQSKQVLKQVLGLTGGVPSSSPAAKGKAKRKSTTQGDTASREKKRRLSSESSSSARVKREPSDARPEEEGESQSAWPEPLRSCDSPSSLSSYCSQRSGSRQSRVKPSSSKSRSEKGASHRDGSASASSDKSKKHHHHHHYREKKESSWRAGKLPSDAGGAVSARAATPSDAHCCHPPAGANASANLVSSSQVNSWEGVLSSSDQSEVHGHETPGNKMSSLGAEGGGMPATAKVKEEPSDSRGVPGPNPELPAHNSRRDWETKNGSSEYYLYEAKKLKHLADKEGDRTMQAVKYLEAVLYFILTGNAMEHNHADLDNTFNMYKETLTLIKWISSKSQKLQNDVYGSIDNKLAVLSLRCQSLLYQKLYKLRKNEVRENMRALSEFQKGSLGKLASPTATGAVRLQPSPCQPSPHSPTPSPAGSVGSQSSGYSSSELATNPPGHHNHHHHNGTTRNIPPAHQVPTGVVQAVTPAAAVGPPAVAVPQAQYLMLQRQSATLTNLHKCHELWEQADSLIPWSHSKEFFSELDRDCGKLSFHSSTQDLVKYVREGVYRLRKRLAAASADT